MPVTLNTGAQLLDVLRGKKSIVLHSGCAEPAWIAEQIAHFASELRGSRVLAFMPMGKTPYADPPASDYLRNATFFPGKGLRNALTHNRVVPLRMAMSQIPLAFQSGQVIADALALQVSPPDAAGKVSLGIAVDFMPAVLRQRPTVIAQVNPRMPRTEGDGSLSLEAIDYLVDADCPIQTIAPSAPDAVDKSIARHVAALVGDGAVLQVGIGSLPDAVLAQLGHLKHLGLHSGIITDAVVPLIRSGVIDNSRKTHLPGVCVTTMAGGTADFYEFINGNRLIEFHPCTTTHDFAVLGSIDRLTAINSALQVDLLGNVNAESIGEKKISMPGGLPDFAAGACASRGGLSILAIRSTAGGSGNIVNRFAASVPRTITMDRVDYVVTEHGSAKVRGVSMAQRARALLSIADPASRDRLQAESQASGSTS